MTTFWERLVSLPRQRKTPQIYVFGDSHTVALLQALAYEKRADMFKEITVLRVRKSKDGKELGDESVDQFCRRIARLKTDDYVFSAIGGNQYAIISTIKHERDFIVLDRHGNHSTAAEVVPHRALGSYIESGVRHSDGAVLRKIRAATQARLYHLSPPPPKSDNEFIRKFHETRFAAAGLGLLEPTDPAFRLACWKMQQESLSTLCADVNVKLLPPPDNAVTQDGYLGRAFYSKDVTHANRRYGEQVLRQILEVVHSRKDSGTHA